MSHALRAPHYGVLSESERLRLSTLSALEAREWASTRRQQAELLVRNLLVIQNDYAPIHKLPDELLVEIFRCVQITASNLEDWILLSWVCHYWRLLVLGTPHFWTKLDLEYNEEILRLFLERSENHLLDVLIGDAGISDNDLMSTLTPRTHRIRSLEVGDLTRDSRRHLESLLSHRENPFVNLECLSLCISDYNPTNKLLQVQVPIQRFPRLHSLVLKGVTLPWTSPILTGLQELSLDRLGQRCSPTVNVFLDILEACPDLRRLTVDNALKKASATTPYLNPGRIISLPRLEKMRLSDSFKLLSLLLDHMSTPSTAIIEVSVKAFYRDCSRNTGNPSLFPLDARKNLSLMDVKTLDYYFDFASLEIRGSTTYPTETDDWLDDATVQFVVLSASEEPVNESYEDLIEAQCAAWNLLRDVSIGLRPCSILKLSINSAVILYFDDWQHMLIALPSLLCLAVHGYCFTDSLSEALASLSADGSIMLCPLLEEFRLHCSYSTYPITAPMWTSLSYRAECGRRLRLFVFDSPGREVWYDPCRGFKARAEAEGLVDAVYCIYCNNVVSTTDHDDEVQQVGEQLLVDSP